MIFTSSDKFLVMPGPLRWHFANNCDITTVQLSNGTVHKFHKFHEIVTFRENAFPPSIFTLGMLRLR